MMSIYRTFVTKWRISYLGHVSYLYDVDVIDMMYMYYIYVIRKLYMSYLYVIKNIDDKNGNVDFMVW